MYDNRSAPPAAAATGVGYGVPNPLGIGGAKAPGGAIPTLSAAPTGASKTDLLRSMYQSRQQPQLHQPQQPQIHQPQQQGQIMQQPQQQPTQRPSSTAYANVQNVHQQQQ